MSPKPTYYDLLNLPEDATTEEIRRAYHEAARRLHPDVNREEGASEGFIKVQRAYEVLINTEARGKYDEVLAAQDSSPVVKKILFSREAVSVLPEEQLVYVLMDFSARAELVSKKEPAINLCLVLDRSTSMQGERMDTVKLAATELVRQLKAEDMLSIVAFSDRAEVLLSAGRRPERAVVETQIRMMRPGGGTEIFQGLQAGLLEVQRYANQTAINHILLLTDGRTYGDEEACLELSERAAMQGVRITGLGIGADWNDAFLDELAGRTGGESAYVAKARDIQRFLKEKFKGLSEIYGEQTRLDFECGAGVRMESAFRLQPNAAELAISGSEENRGGDGGKSISMRLGSIPKHGKLSVLIEFALDAVTDHPQRVMLGTGTLKTVLTGAAAHGAVATKGAASKAEMGFTLSRVTEEATQIELPPQAIFQALSQINLYRMQERAREEVSDGKIQQASTRLQRLATQLLALGERDLAQTALMEAERIQQTHVFSAEGEKEIKYGTRCLLLPGRIDGSEENRGGAGWSIPPGGIRSPDNRRGVGE